MTGNDPHSQQEMLMGIDEVECVTPDLNGVPRGKVMTAEGFLEGRRLQLARGVLLQCIMGGYPPARFYGSDDGDLALIGDPQQLHRLPWSTSPRALAICDAQDLDGQPCMLSTRNQLKAVIARYAAQDLVPVVATELEFLSLRPIPSRFIRLSRRPGWTGGANRGTRHSASAPTTACGLFSPRCMPAWPRWGCRVTR